MVDSELISEEGAEACALCRKVKVLRESHFFPKSAYKHVRAKGDFEDSPIRVSAKEGDAFYSDSQITKELLCTSCEQLFSKYGENIVSRVWSTRKDFPFLDILKKVRLESSDEGCELFNSASFPEGLLNGLYYFAASIIWRAHAWSDRGSNLSRVNLGPYEKIFRNFLLSHAEMKRVRLIVTVNVHRSINGVMIVPVFQKMFGRHAYMFEILGLKFHLFVGGDERCDLYKSFVLMRSNVIVMTSIAAEAASHNAMRKLVHSGIIPRGRLAKESAGK